MGKVTVYQYVVLDTTSSSGARPAAGERGKLSMD
jgi:hypothetical protein